MNRFDPSHVALKKPSNKENQVKINEDVKLKKSPKKKNKKDHPSEDQMLISSFMVKTTSESPKKETVQATSPKSTPESGKKTKKTKNITSESQGTIVFSSSFTFSILTALFLS